MKNSIRCKVCGYVMDEKNLKDVCPACGVPRTAFAPYKPSISEKRENVLNLHLHPISIHFPEAIAVFTAFFMIVAFITSGTLSNDLIIANKMLLILFPITIIVAFLTGLYDAKIRFKKLSPPLLKRKIVIGVILFVSSIASLILIMNVPFSSGEKCILLILSLVNVVTCVALGTIGGTLIDSKMPG